MLANSDQLETTFNISLTIFFSILDLLIVNKATVLSEKRVGFGYTPHLMKKTTTLLCLIFLSNCPLFDLEPRNSIVQETSSHFTLYSDKQLSPSALYYGDVS